MNIILIDDDIRYLEELRKTVDILCRTERIQAKISDTDDPREVIEDELWKKNNVILLDIDMPKISGIELASQINALKGDAEKPYIIFVTERDGMVFEALREQPYSFVRKSAIEDLVPCFKRIESRLNAEDTFAIHTAGALNRIPINEIMYIEKQGNYVVFHTVSIELKERASLEEKYSELNPYSFIRIHAGCAVNPRFIRTVEADYVILEDDTKLAVSRAYKKTVKKEFFDWMVKN